MRRQRLGGGSKAARSCALKGEAGGALAAGLTFMAGFNNGGSSLAWGLCLSLRPGAQGEGG